MSTAERFVEAAGPAVLDLPVASSVCANNAVVVWESLFAVFVVEDAFSKRAALRVLMLCIACQCQTLGFSPSLQTLETGVWMSMR